MTTRILDGESPRKFAKRAIVAATLLTLVATPPYTLAAGLTDIANAPISSAATTAMPPNVMFMLDDSGSMGSDYMPDDMNGYDGRVSFASHLCNTIYYNPSATYLPPKQADGTDFPDSTFTNAQNDGFLGSSTTDLSNNFKGTDVSGSERAFYYKWTGATPPSASDCRGSAPSASRSFPHTTGSWQKVQIPAADEKNFANWFSYYRTRMNVMKSSAGRAFSSLNDSYRVGFLTICPNTSWNCSGDWGTRNVDAAKYLKIDTFNAAHKSAWYNKFYSQNPGGFTPLREALSRAGRHFAGKTDGLNTGMNDDPIQYSCQQNYAILTTDGYWNYGQGRILNGTSTGSSTYIGDQDADIGLTPRPMFDGGTKTTEVTEDYYTDVRSAGSSGCTSSQRRADQWQRTTTTGQSGNVSSTGWSRISNNLCYPKATIDNAFTASCAQTSSSGPSSSTSGCASAPVASSTGSVGNTLADVAEYYYRLDLRPSPSTGALGTDVSANNVPAAGSGVEDDKATHQHMTTFTLGMGLSGQLKYDPNYKSQTTGDFADIRTGAKGWPDPDPTTNTTGNLATQAARIDDLWHAAVNGRGTYFSASDPAALALSLQTALSQIQTRLASAAAAATSNLEPTQEDRLIFTPKYTTNEWSGDVEAKELDITTGAVIPDIVWSAQAKLAPHVKAACDTRTIYLHRKGATDPIGVVNNLAPFTWNTAKCDAAGNPEATTSTGLTTAEQDYFTAAGSKDEPSDLSQWSLMTDGTILGTVDQKSVATGANLVNFVRGHRGLEGFVPNDLTKLYRTRKSVLGDIVNSQPIYVRKAFFEYNDAGYGDFVTSVAGRTPMLYVAANDGMLHAFYAGTTPTDPNGGEEAWTFIPRTVLPRLYKLADNNYPNLHEYNVDGKPVAAEVYDTATSTWRTILVGGLNKGGRAYYALDITDPQKPKALWEFAAPTGATCVDDDFSDCDLGYTYGNPVVTKLTTGQWVVLVTSGYNNVNPGDGRGHLYVLDAMTGKKLNKITTSTVGSVTDPSGLNKISASVTTLPNQNNTVSLVYGVDLLGNVWRFDVNDIFGAPGTEATLLATVKDAAGIPQPITTRPELAGLGSPPEPFVIVATGRYYGASDVADKQTQSIYAFRDPLTTTPYADLRLVLKQNVMTTNATTLERFVSCDTTNPAANCGSTDGWYVDLPDSGERVNVDMRLQLGTLVAVTNVPGNSACEPGGYSYKVYFNYATGLSPLGSTYPVGSKFSSALAVGINIVRLPDGRVIVIGMDSTGTAITFPAPTGGGQAVGKRITWREIIM